MKRVADGLEPALTCLNDAEKFLAGTSASLKKKHRGVLLSTTHKHAVQVAADKVAAAVSSLLDAELNKNVAWAMQVC